MLDLVRNAPRVPEKFFKHLTDSDSLYEMRIRSGSDIYRVFCFFDAGQLVVVLTGFVKKTDKTPRAELQRAHRLKDEYFQQKTQPKS